MLTYEQLYALAHALRGTRVLSVYVTDAAPDPAARDRWKVQLRAALASIRARLADASHGERADFDACVAALERDHAAAGGPVGAPGYAAFVTADGVWYAEPLSAPVPTLVSWTEGARIAPYLPALAQQAPIAVGVVDAKTARLYRYRAAALEHLDTLHAHTELGPYYHMGDAPRAGFHTGTRGTAGADAAAAGLRAARDQMLAELGRRLQAVAGADGWVVIGGIPDVARAAAESLSSSVRARCATLVSLDVHASPAEVAEAAAHGAAALRGARDLALVEQAIDRARADGRAAVRPDVVGRAADAGAVHTLLLSTSYIERAPAEADVLVKTAAAQGALVLAVSEDAARRLDQESDGVCALLRFVPYVAPPTPAAASAASAL